MKKKILMLFVSMIICSASYAGEEIQLAAVMTESGSSDIQANKKIYASDSSRSSGGSGSVSRTPGFEFAVVAGVAIAATIASVAEGGSDSTSNH